MVATCSLSSSKRWCDMSKAWEALDMTPHIVHATRLTATLISRSLTRHLQGSDSDATHWAGRARAFLFGCNPILREVRHLRHLSAG